MSQVVRATAHQFRRPHLVRGKSFIFAFQDEGGRRASSVIVGLIQNAWTAGTGETRANVSVLGPSENGFRSLMLTDMDEMYMIMNNGERMPGWFELVDGSPHVLWQRFSPIMTPKLWDRLPLSNPLGAMGKSVAFRSNMDVSLSVAINGTLIGLRSMLHEPNACVATVQSTSPLPLYLVLDPEGRWKYFPLRSTGTVHGTVTFG
jgi:hypothetical protein